MIESRFICRDSVRMECDARHPMAPPSLCTHVHRDSLACMRRQRQIGQRTGRIASATSNTRVLTRPKVISATNASLCGRGRTCSDVYPALRGGLVQPIPTHSICPLHLYPPRNVPLLRCKDELPRESKLAERIAAMVQSPASSKVMPP